eukprot:TRINITY_DN11542_c0_g1_i2.p1 TRINITY_DN11542_c0_g1~~TRINITY_DN11542_c0_g1_i2.p1  ORF type:complete len:362 (-),score=114.42 TRINITY_DN11542_c0_g1_i2:247-1332(-)
MFCRQCARPLRFEAPNTTEGALSESSSEAEDAQQPAEESRHPAPSASFLHQSIAGMDESFVILPKVLAESMHTSKYVTDTAEQLQIEQQILQLVSQKSQVDQPVCQDCVSRILAELDLQYKNAQQQKEQYRASLKELDQREFELIDDQAFEQQIYEFERAEAALLGQLSSLQSEQSTLQDELESVRKSTEEVEEEEYRYWRSFNEYQLQYEQFIDDRDSLVRRIEVSQTKLQELQRTDIFDECFHIGLSGPHNCFGTICGFRMGTTSQIKVPWHEINAAWGQAALLLYTLAKQCSFQFSQYDIVPKGSYSYMLRRSDNYEYELCVPGQHYSLRCPGMHWAIVSLWWPTDATTRRCNSSCST